MTARSPKPKLRKREIAFAIGMGLVAAGGVAIVLEESRDEPVRQHRALADRATYAVAPFEEISTVGPQDVVITRGEAHAVRAEGSPDALAQLEAVVQDGELIIRPKDQFGPGFDWSDFEDVTFFVTAPQLERLSLAGSGDVRIDRVEGETFAGTIAGSGELEIGSLRVDEIDLTIAGSGNLVAAGIARETRVSIGGSGEVHASALQSRIASVSIAGSGDVDLTVAEEADVSIMGSGNVDIAGPARCSVSRMGSGEVRCDSD